MNRRERLLNEVPRPCSLVRAVGPILGLVLLAMSPADPAKAANCIATASGTWGPISAGSATWSCGGGAPAEGDYFRIPAGVSVHVQADIVQSAIASIGIEVKSGGELHVARSEGAERLVLGGEGLLCQSGSHCVIGGRVRAFDAAGGSTPVEEAKSYLTVTQVTPCPNAAGNAQCAASATTPARVRLEVGGFAAGAATLQAVAAITPGHDILCFATDDPGASAISPDVGHCYDVVAVQASSFPYFVEIDVHQGRRDKAGYGLARREIVEDVAAEAVGAGGRDVFVSPALLASGEDGDLVGRWLRVEAADGKPEPRGYKILASFDCSLVSGRSAACGPTDADLLRIGDVRDVASAVPAGRRVWLDYGWEEGDRFLVLDPVHVTSATPQAVDSSVLLDGASDLSNVLLDDVRMVRLQTGPVERFRRVWIRDPTNLTGASLRLEYLEDAELEHIAISGGDDDAAGLCDAPPPDLDCPARTHGIVFLGLEDVTVRDVAIRHASDDCAVASPGPTSHDVRFERLHCAFITRHAHSANLFSLGVTTDEDISLIDGVCDDCTDGDIVYQGPASPGYAFLSGVLAWGVRGETADVSSATTMVEDLAVLGTHANNGRQLLPRHVDRFLVRESENRATNQSAAAFYGNSSEARNGYLRDVTIGSPSAVHAPGPVVLENLAAVDLRTTNGTCTSQQCPAIWTASPTSALLQQVTLAWRPSVSGGFNSALRLTGPNTGLTLDGLLLTGFSGPGVSRALDMTAANAIAAFSHGGAGPCLDDNQAHATSDVLAVLPPTALVDVDPGYVDLAAGRVDTAAGSPSAQAGCGIGRGATAPGVGPRWMHRISRIHPERPIDDPDLDGVPTDAAAPPCPSGDTLGCSDNCPAVSNPGQRDTDGSGAGDACDDLCLGTQTILTSVFPAQGPPGQIVEVQATGISPAAWLELSTVRVPITESAGRRVATMPVLSARAYDAGLVNPEGCRSQQAVSFTITPPTTGCGLFGIEALLALVPWRVVRARARGGGAAPVRTRR